LQVLMLCVGLSSCQASESGGEVGGNKLAITHPEVPEGIVIRRTEGSLDAKYFINSFNEFCAANMPRLDKIRSASRLFEWEDLPDDMQIMISPADPETPFDSWFIREGRVSLMIGITEPIWEGQKTEACSLAADINGNDLDYYLNKNFDGKEAYVNEVQSGQKYRIWKTPDYIYTIVDATPSDMTGASISMMRVSGK